MDRGMVVFIGALRGEGDHFRRDPSRPMPPFARDGLFPEGVLFSAEPRGRRVLIRRLP